MGGVSGPGNSLDYTVFPTRIAHSTRFQTEKFCYIINIREHLLVGALITSAKFRDARADLRNQRLHTPHASSRTAARLYFAMLHSGHPLCINCYQFTDPLRMDGLVYRARPRM
jgi:hypothetical protein